MARVRVFTIDLEGYDMPLKISSLNFREAREHSQQSVELNKDPGSVPTEEWNRRMFDVIFRSIKTADPEQGISKIEDLEEFDMPTLIFIYRKILEKSGLMLPEGKQGEARAA